MTGTYFAILAVFVVAAYLAGSMRARASGADARELHSLPAYHGFFLASAVLVPMLAIFVIGAPLGARYVVHSALSAFDPSVLADQLQSSTVLRDIELLASGQYQGQPSDDLRSAALLYSSARTLVDWGLIATAIGAGLVSFGYFYRQIVPQSRARNRFESVVKVVLLACSAVAVLTTIGIVLSVLFETIQFFEKVSPFDFLFGLQWSPQTALRTDQVGSSGAFGIVPLVLGTLLITLIAMLVAGPLGLFSAIYMAEYASPKIRALVKPLLEILAGIPTVVLGFFAALTVAPVIRHAGFTLGLDVASEIGARRRPCHGDDDHSLCVLALR